MFTRTIRRHDTKVQAWARFLDEGDEPMDLTDCTLVYSLSNVVTGALKITRATAFIRDQASFPGEVLYQFETSDVDTEMYGEEEFEVTYSDGMKESFPTRDEDRVTVHIIADLDGV